MTLGFAGLELDRALFELRRDGTRIPLEPQAFDVLVYLLDHRDRVVSKEELMDQVWGGRFVSETAVTTRIKQLRRAVGDDGQAQRVVKTQQGRGYHFVASVVDQPGGPAAIDAPAVAAAPPTSPPLPLPPASAAESSGRAALFGRTNEVGLLHRLFEQTTAGRGCAVLLTGEPGIGKSALVEDLVRYAETHGALVLTGRATAGGGSYRPLTEALMSLQRRGSIPDVPELLPFRSALARILPGWSGDTAYEPGVDPGLVLGEGIVRLLLALGRPPYVVALEDLHDADADTLSVLDYLAAAVSSLPIMVVGTHRDWPRVERLERLARAPYAHRIQLPRLSADAVAALVDEIRTLPPPVRDLVVQRSEGLPMVVSELAAAVDEQQHDRWSVPDSFGALMAARLATLSEQEHRVLGAASVLGPAPDWDLVPAVAGVADAAVSDAAGRAVDLQLLVVDGNVLRWKHGLVRQAIWSTVLPLVRRVLARRAADLLQARGTTQADAAAAELLLATGDTERAADVLLGLAEQAIHGGALHTASDFIERAAASGHRAARVSILRVHLMTLDGRVTEALAGAESALDGALGDEHAELCLGLAHAAVQAGRWRDAEELLDRSGRPHVARALIVATDAAHGVGRIEEAAALAVEAVAAARNGQPAEVLCDALCAQARVARLTDRTAAVGAFREAAQVASEHGLRPARVEALFGLGTIQLLLDEDGPALVEARDLALQLGLLMTVGRAEMLLTENQLVVHGPAGLEEPAQRLIELGEVLRSGLFGFVGQQLLATQRALAARPRGAGGPGDSPTDSALPPDTRGQFETVQAYAALAGHDLDGALGLLEQGLRPPLSHGSSAPLAVFGLWAVVSAAVRGEEDDVRGELASRPGLLRRANRGALAYAEAIVAGRRQEPAAAAAAYATGTALLSATPWWARLLRLVTLEAALADGWGEPVPALRADLTAYEEAGESAFGRICRDLLRRAGVETRRGRGDAVVPAALRALGITSRELDVLGLVVAGLSNAAISDQLFLSPRTVETHVANLLAKSGSANRHTLSTWFLHAEGQSR